MSNLKRYKMFIDGDWVESKSKKTFKTLNPENNEPWAEVPEANKNDVDSSKAVKKLLLELVKLFREIELNI